MTINIFLFFIIFGDVFSQLSQTYLPRYFINDNNNNNNYYDINNNIRNNDNFNNINNNNIDNNNTMNNNGNNNKNNNDNINNNKLKNSEKFIQNNILSINLILTKILRVSLAVGTINFLCCFLLPKTNYNVFLISYFFNFIVL